MDKKVNELYSKDNNEAYKILLELEMVSTDSDEFYKYFDEFLKMIGDERSFVRVRGFRMICSLAKWDKNDLINHNINIILQELDDNSGTAIRQCLKFINLILMYKLELAPIIEAKLLNIDISKYKESMQKLIKNDIQIVLQNL